MPMAKSGVGGFSIGNAAAVSGNFAADFSMSRSAAFC
jgi:hypothetical protein